MAHRVLEEEAVKRVDKNPEDGTDGERQTPDQ
jgi:hypothetical protein